MPDAAPSIDLLRSLGRMVRGLSALFWGLPLTLVASVETAKTDWLRSLGFLPPLLGNALLLYGLWLLGSFQKDKQKWRVALDRGKLLAIMNIGLCPFLYWWSQAPSQMFFGLMVVLHALTGMIFLITLNLVLRRLGIMLPDETLRQETRHFTTLNRNLLLIMMLLVIAYLLLLQWKDMPLVVGVILVAFEQIGFWLLVFLVLLPVAMTMALLWKTKEVIYDSVFGGKR